MKVQHSLTRLVLIFYLKAVFEYNFIFVDSCPRGRNDDTVTWTQTVGFSVIVLMIICKNHSQM